MSQARIERALRAGPPFRPVPIPPMPAIGHARRSRVDTRPVALLLTVLVTVVLGAVAVALYQAARNIGSPEARITVEDFPVTVSLDVPLGLSLQQDEDFGLRKGWSEAAGGSGPAQRGIALAYLPEPEVHRCAGSTSREVVRREPFGLLEDLGVVAAFDVRDIERLIVGGRSAASAVVLGPGCGPDIHLEPIGLGDEALMLEMRVPSRLVAVDVDGQTVLLQFWAQTEEDLADWIDETGPLLDSMTIEQHR